MTTANLPGFRQEGQLRIAGLSNTITDVIRLTGEMGIPYLWVDALCTIQEGDGGADKARQIPVMDAVYGLSELTIVQASGQDSKCPLLGFGDDSTPPRQTQGEIKPGLWVALQMTGFDDKQKASSTWNTRAWTSQEAVLSPRLLIFHHGHVTWECRERVWCEDMSTEPGDTPQPAKSSSFMPQFGSQMLPVGASELQEIHNELQSLESIDHLGRNDHISRYESAVQEYTSREMTYWGDKLNAFAGLGAIYERQMGTKLVFGLPANQLDMALLWTTTDGASLERLPDFPSWSWAGWKGAVHHPSSNPVALSPTCHFWIVDKDNRATDDGKMQLKRLVQAWEADDYVPHERPVRVRPIDPGNRTRYPKVGVSRCLDRSHTDHLDPKMDLSKCLCFETLHSNASHFSIKDGRKLVFNLTGKVVGGIALDEPLGAAGLTADMELARLNMCTIGQRNREEEYFPEFLFSTPGLGGNMVMEAKDSPARRSEPHMEWCRVLLVEKRADGSVKRRGIGDMMGAALYDLKQKMLFLS
ncbi:heterokaryon incompatibility protein [Colletotrichum graminicola]|uniref:Heterokaryon incompatibility protein n=1 Tax=Colletotrichum graminicola (strain M1.001 / M2 / FGSC 10212) TaxID=645133 RepID=E3QMH7_COLGM|nr:heterokaryon incompatibility protein [Colletotrichum graminicola M1.001]EFQ32065.1 heterokaryon incompatibility protein [Colletotrichum graminicola M1.001]WDK17050.1 heterokaryon incompatibility protein [Colletotrichum graminicola]